MPRRKPDSATQRKAKLQLKRAIKRGDLPPEAISPSHVANKKARSRQPSEVDAKVQSSRRLQSTFVKMSPAFLEEAKEKASSLVLMRPLPLERTLFPPGDILPLSITSKLTIIKRPKWNYEMTKKQVESNEEGIFKKWLAETDDAIQAWKDREAPVKTTGEELQSSESEAHGHPIDGMPYSAPLFERNLEVWRQMWRVTEICQILLILLDSRCPLLHYPESLHNYLSSLRTPRKIIFVLTKVDISGPERSSLWKEYLQSKYPGTRVVKVESYLERKQREGQGKRKAFDPQIPTALRRDLVDAIKAAHTELCVPPPHIASHVQKLASWKPNVIRAVDWNAVLNAGEIDILHHRHISPQNNERDTTEQCPDIESDIDQDCVSIGLIGQPNVGKSSLLNALFGQKKVRASKTPGKTKHFQSLFWTNQIRLVDCPGLVFPSYVNMEMQVLAGTLPVSQISAIPSCVYHALQYIPLEKILGLKHPAEEDPTVEDKRTWREGKRPKISSDLSWTAMDVLTAFANKRGWITAKAGRPDVNRAGNALMRELAEGKIKWAFYPSTAEIRNSLKDNGGTGIWIKGAEDDDPKGYDTDSNSNDPDSATSLSDSEKSDEFDGEGEDYDDDLPAEHISAGTGMFAALVIEDFEEEDIED
ncbi:hypothetical protein M0805_000905 [Coniferiporia weirii]|nr:hypothetical protein M0805_000905 [Coniferiporia weirii]